MAHAHESHDSHGDHHAPKLSPPTGPVQAAVALVLGVALTVITLWALLA